MLRRQCFTLYFDIVCNLIFGVYFGLYGDSIERSKSDIRNCNDLIVFFIALNMQVHIIKSARLEIKVYKIKFEIFSEDIPSRFSNIIIRWQNHCDRRTRLALVKIPTTNVVCWKIWL